MKPLHDMPDDKAQDEQPLLLHADPTEIMTGFVPFLVPLVLYTILFLHLILTVAHSKVLLELILYHREIISLLGKEGNLAN